MSLRIKELREAKGFRQVDLANFVGVNHSAVANWEKGVALPRTKDLPTIAEALGCSIDDLFDTESEQQEKETA